MASLNLQVVLLFLIFCLYPFELFQFMNNVCAQKLCMLKSKASWLTSIEVMLLFLAYSTCFDSITPCVEGQK